MDTDLDEDWTGISSEAKGKQKEDEYEDEEVLATVTVVEDFDPDSIIHGPPPSTPHQSQPAEESTTTQVPRDLKVTAKKPSKRKKVKYQTKAERRVEHEKQRARRTEKAELAGGKAARKKGSSASKKIKGSRR